MRPPLNRGFTLVEVVVALTIAALAVLVVHPAFTAAGVGSASLRASRQALDGRINAHRWLAAALASLEVGRDGSAPFEGRSDRVAFSAYLLTAEGWFERRRVSLTRRGKVLVAQAGDQTLMLGQEVTEVEFDYLLELGAGERWIAAWSSPVSAPLAVRLRVIRPESAETTLFLVRERG